MTSKSKSMNGQFMGIGYAQWIKLAVYSLLLINFGNYILLDINQVNHTYHEGWPIRFLTARAAWFTVCPHCS